MIPFETALHRIPLLPLLLTLLLAACGAASGENGPDGDSPQAGEEQAGQERVDAPAPSATPVRGQAWVIFGADTVVAEVARTPDERAQGLKDRSEVPDGTGMLFVFEDSATRSFWMQDTYVPLDIAYIDESAVIVDIQQMEPESTDYYDSAAPAMFALEVRQGWFAEHDIEVGDTARIVFGG